jgi:hypothetical protein
MRFLATALLFIPLFASAKPQFESLKTLDGGVLYCQSNSDFEKVGFHLDNTLVEPSAANLKNLEISFTPNFYRCAKTAKGFQWQPSTVNAYLSQEVQTDDGLVKIVPVSYSWVVYSENYKVLNPQPNSKAANGTKYTISIGDLLSSQEKENHDKGTESRGIVTVFMKYVTKAVYPNGKELNLGQHATGSFNIVITLPAH